MAGEPNDFFEPFEGPVTPSARDAYEVVPRDAVLVDQGEGDE